MLLNYVLAILSGLLLTAVHPRWNLTLLAPFALAPLVYALLREWEPRHRFLLGYAAGLAFWATINYWIQFVLSVHGGLGTGLGTVGFVVFVLLRAIPMGLFALLAGVVVQRRYAVLAVPCLWVAMERLPWLFQYTWLHLGNAGIDMGLPVRLAPILGVYAISWVFAALGTAIAVVAFRRSRRELVWLAPIALLFMLPDLPAPQVPQKTAASVQPNIPERDDWTDELARSTHTQLEALSLRAVYDGSGRPVSLILWPEVPAPVYYVEDPALRDRVNAMAATAKAHVLIGTVAHNERGAPLNAAMMVTPQGTVSGRYDKMFLVPFGEYVPFPFGGLLGSIASEAGDFVAGSRVVLFESAGEKVGPFICYESAFPHLVRRFTAAGATVLANLSNDGYFGGAAAREQHLSLVRMRAVENRRWILRSTNDGITAAIDPAGRVVTRLPEFQATSGRLGYDVRSDLTPYVRFGDVFAWSATTLAGLLLVLSQIPSYNRG
ncbi:MAG TPA: apolipoprotein N-acyltransferase [Bryobacteraceae bacterium]|nr:apolipoprotein N-acyltransferase [Bryobacteraceae bacterium]